MDIDYGLRMFDLVYIIRGLLNLFLRDFCFVFVLAFALYLSIAFPCHIFSLVELFSASVLFSWRFAFSGYTLSGQGAVRIILLIDYTHYHKFILQRSDEACRRDIVCVRGFIIRVWTTLDAFAMAVSFAGDVG